MSIHPTDTPYEAILDVVRAHHDRGTPRTVVQRALIELAADHLAEDIKRAVEEVYGALV